MGVVAAAVFRAYMRISLPLSVDEEFPDKEGTEFERGLVEGVVADMIIP
jgi:hypothetical protein